MKHSKQHLNEAAKTLKSIKSKLNESRLPVWVQKIQRLQHNIFNAELVQMKSGLQNIVPTVSAEYGDILTDKNYFDDAGEYKQADANAIKFVHERHLKTIKRISELDDMLHHLKNVSKIEQDFLKSPNK